MKRTTTYALVLLAVAGGLSACNQAQEDRAAEQAANAIREGNQALRELKSTAKEGAEKAAAAARDAGRDAAPVINDATLTAKVKTALLADGAVSGMSIDVDTKDGVVTLSGQLPDAGQAARAVDIARKIDGVKSVQNRLTAQASG
jgi:hyperosmotically inducible protein